MNGLIPVGAVPETLAGSRTSKEEADDHVEVPASTCARAVRGTVSMASITVV